MLKFFRTNKEPRDDQSLLKSYQAHGRMEDIGLLFERYIELVYGLCLKYLEQEADAEDAVMQIFEKLVVKAKEHQVNQFKSWLYVLSKNHCLMLLRKRSNKKEENNSPEFMQFLDQGHLIEGDEFVEIEEKKENMFECLKQLPESQQLCIKLFYLEKISYKEIAEQEQLDINKVRSFIQNGRRNLRNCIEAKEKALKDFGEA